MKTILDISKDIGAPIEIVNNDYMNVVKHKVIVILNSGEGERLTMKQLHKMFDMLGGGVIVTDPEYLKYSDPVSYKVLAYVTDPYYKELYEEYRILLKYVLTNDDNATEVKFRSIAHDPDFLIL